MTRPQSAGKPALPKPIVVVDVETTGLDPGDDSILEIGACLLDPDLSERASFFSRVHSTRRSSVAAFNTHGLSIEDVANAPRLGEVIRQFDAFAPRGAVLSGHNVSFDVGFMRAAWKREHVSFQYDYHLLDIWSIAFFVLGARAVKLPKYNLTALCSLFGIPRDPQHSALQDARASAAILRHLALVVQDGEIDIFGQFSLTSTSR